MPLPFWVPPQVSLVSPPLVLRESCTGVPPWHGVSLYLLMKPGFEPGLGVGGEQRPHCRDPGVQLSLSPPRAGAAGGIRTLHRPPRLLTTAQLDYRPALTTEPALGGVRTTSTFVVDQPRCVFQDYGNAVIWLVVALEQGRWEQPRAGGVQGVSLCPPPTLLTPIPIPAAASTFNNSQRPGTPETAFQGFPEPVRAYMTLNATLGSYPCPKPDGDIAVLRVGSETSCTGDVTRPTCNGPLPTPGPYR